MSTSWDYPTNFLIFAKVLVGHIPGGLGHVNVVARIIFFPACRGRGRCRGFGASRNRGDADTGYDDDFTVAITASSSIIGPIILP